MVRSLRSSFRESHQPEKDPERQWGAPRMGGVSIDLVQGGKERQLGSLPGCKTELEELGQRWDMRCLRHQPQQMSIGCVDQLQKQEGFYSTRSESCRLRQGEMER